MASETCRLLASTAATPKGILRKKLRYPTMKYERLFRARSQSATQPPVKLPAIPAATVTAPKRKPARATPSPWVRTKKEGIQAASPPTEKVPMDCETVI